MTEHKLINPPELLPGVGFSHVVVAAPGRTVYIAGQTAHQRDGYVKGGRIVEQVDAALANLVTALRAAGAQPEHLVSMQLFVTDVAAFRDGLEEIGAVWRRHLGYHYPAVSLLGINTLFDPDALIEVVATAVIPD